MIAPRPQSYETLRQRYPEALRQVYDAPLPNPRPGEQIQQVFDHIAGVRLIISRDRYDGKTVLHVSASWWMSNLGDNIALDQVFARILKATSEVTGQLDPASHLIGISVKGIPHFIFPDPGPP